MQPPSESKSDLRRQARQTLAALTPDALSTASATIAARIAEWGPYLAARAVMVFMPLPGEIDLRPLIRTMAAPNTVAPAGAKLICIPRVDWQAKSMAPALITAATTLIPGRHGILEPPPEVESLPLDRLDLILIPGLAFDAAGHRLGRGAGFYDRFLADPALAGAVTCGVCLDAQIVPSVPSESWDIPVKAIATDNRLIVVR